MPDRSKVKNKMRRERIDVNCSCGASLKAPKKAVGKRVKCPRCNQILTVHDPGSPLDRALCALGDEEYNKPALEEQPPAPEPVKTEEGKVRPTQQRVIDEWEEAGLPVAVVRSIDDVIVVFEKYREEVY